MRASNRRSAPKIVGVGINALDTVIRLPRFPAPDSKVELHSVQAMPGGQVASAMVACRRWGVRVLYVGKIADDATGKLQVAEMKRERVDARWIVAKGCRSQFSFILVDETTGDRTVLWNRDPKIALRAKDLKRNWIRGANALLVDGHDTEAAAQAARWARADGIPVVGDFDNRYLGVEALLEHVDYPITSKDFPERLTGESNLLKSLPKIHTQFKCRLTVATLGSAGVIAWDGKQFLQCPAFQIKAVDTTGAGDIFHGAFLYGLVQGWRIDEILEFSCAAAALNCQAMGARGGIASVKKIEALRRSGSRHPLPYSEYQLRDAARAAMSAEEAMT
ncbi:MAG TPA: PfkB family carbohydrate kinase [Candidatus Dormibacteraeota bacterium]|nr:PfkB family carbohydrate kinase [Candidatus Dormibacteraeota bacterium]